MSPRKIKVMPNRWASSSRLTLWTFSCWTSCNDTNTITSYSIPASSVVQRRRFWDAVSDSLEVRPYRQRRWGRQGLGMFSFPSRPLAGPDKIDHVALLRNVLQPQDRLLVDLGVLQARSGPMRFFWGKQGGVGVPKIAQELNDEPVSSHVSVYTKGSVGYTVFRAVDPDRKSVV